MFGGAAAFLVIALVAAVVGDTGIGGMSLNIAWILFLFGLIFEALFSFSKGRAQSSRHLPRVLDGPHAARDE
jgi:uncharacterized membrane protein YtjA (UPF0391 family)